MNNLVAKQNLTSDQLVMVQTEMNNKQKSKGIAYALWFFLGGLGAHRFYAGNIGIAIGMLLTLGGLGVWTLIDVFFIGKEIERQNDQLEMNIINTVKTLNNSDTVSSKNAI